jgi:hypothetical protein
VAITSGVIQRVNGTSSSPAPSSIPASSASSRRAQARSPASSAPSAASSEPPGKTQTPGMNFASSLRRSISTSSARCECFPPRRSSTTEAAGRGVDGGPKLGISAGPRRRSSMQATLTPNLSQSSRGSETDSRVS